MLTGMAWTAVGTRRGNRIVGLTRWRRSERPIAERRKTTRGQALAEFAIVAPIMALILVSLVQFAFIFERQIGIENAVRDAARRGATYTTTSSASALTNGVAVLNLLEASLAANTESYSHSNLEWAKVCYADQTDSSGYTSVKITVSARYRHPLFLPIITGIIDGIDGSVDNAFAVQTSSTFTVQNDATTNQSIGGTPVGVQDPVSSCP